MRATQTITAIAATILILATLTPAGTLTHWVAGILLVLASVGAASRADNQDIKYGRTTRTAKVVRVNA